MIPNRMAQPLKKSRKETNNKLTISLLKKIQNSER